MGKDLNGKELGKNITQEKRGYYVGRYVDKYGKRHTKRFSKLKECEQWVADELYMERHSDICNPDEITVDAWYEQWIKIKGKSNKKGSVVNYGRVYNNHISPVIGQMQLVDVKSIHCQLVLNQMGEEGYKNSTIKNVKEVMSNIFNYAYDNDMILRNPCKKSVKYNVGEESEPREAMTVEDQQIFLDAIVGSVYENDFRFVLKTGLRVGELSGLEWKDVDFASRTVRIRRNLERYVEAGGWVENSPKTKAGVRTVPLTLEAIEILRKVKESRKSIKVVPMEWKDKIFLNELGEPVKTSAYNTELKIICKKAGISRISMHILRHTFATRCIENGMKPKNLQKILGHANISITMNLYVHATEDEKLREMDLVASAL